MDDKWKEYIKEKYREYKDIRYIECPAFSNEKIYFNKHGFNHLIRKGFIPRTKEEQIKRLSLLPLSKAIIINSKKYSRYLKKEDKHPIAYFWSLISNNSNVSVTVIVRQLDGGYKHFYSIFYNR